MQMSLVPPLFLYVYSSIFVGATSLFYFLFLSLVTPVDAKNLWLKPNVITWCGRPYTVTLLLIACKRKALRNNGDTGGVSTTSTPILKSVMVLMSKQRGRGLARKSCLYLNRWVDPLFLVIPRGPGHLGDLDGLNSECSRWVDMF